MMRAIISGAMAGLLLGLTCGPARAENPRVHLKLENVTAAEAAAALGKAADVEIQLSTRGQEAAFQEKASFDWSDTTLGTALRQLTRRYPLRLSGHFGGRYQLFADAQGPAPARQSLVEKNGVRIFVRSIGVYSNRQINFDDAQNSDNGNLNIFFGAEMPDGDPEAIVGVDAVSAKDDQGTILTSTRQGAFGRGPFGSSNGYPDEWSGSTSLSSPHPRARKLVWVEGDLLVYKTYRKHRVELAVSDKGQARKVGDATVALTRFDRPPSPATTPDAQDFQVELSMSVPAGASASFSRMPQVRLLGKSGKLYNSSGGGVGTSGGPEGETILITSMFRNVPEPAERAVLFTVETGDPQRLLSFRMANVPLPGEASFIPRHAPAEVRARNGGAAPAPNGGDVAFQQADGSALVTQVSMADRPLAEGVLSIGLAVKDESGWGPLRWTDVDVDEKGQARLEHVKPGVYRVLRVFRTKKQSVPLSDSGTWRNAETTVTVMAGKDATLPPLTWSTVKAPETKPAAKMPPTQRPR